MFQYTYATLKTHMNAWVEGNGSDADADFVAAADEIIQRGELRLYRDLDLDNLDTFDVSATADGTRAVVKPDNLVTERLVLVDVGTRKTQAKKRSRAFVELMNRDDTEGVYATEQNIYYAELSETEWMFAPIPDGVYTVTVHGQYRPDSIVDGAVDGTTTWLSTRFPDLLALACDIEAAEFLKNWARKAVCETEYTSKLDNVQGSMKNLKRADIEDIIGNRNVQQTPTQGPEPEAT